MTLTKVVGAFCGALLIFLLGGWAAELIYHTGGGHGDDHQQAYVIETGNDEGGAEEDTGPSFEELFVAADAGKGERIFNKCKACHQLEEGANGTGPYLYGVVGRDVGSAEGFGYSGSLSAVADVWTPQNLSAFLENPAGYAPGTTMGFAGVKDMEDRANLIAFLDQTDGDTYEVEVPAAAEEEAPAEEPAEETTDAEASEAPANDGAAAEDAASDEAASQEPASDEAAAEEAATEEAAADDSAGGFADVVAAADPADGEKVWRQCRACHKLEDGANGVGPHMAGIVGREIGSVEGFRYSNALQELDGTWTADELNAWLEDPKAYAPGNKMSFRGLRKEEDRAALIAYMQSAAE
ncbi:cytochrome c family protein [Roseovarius sp. MMSF_3281]|uniref:c-type cytochrome n=1 Tax=Roseovarius sp. MMSF_3281 TaxID=3046694 RepID=UPI00273D5D8E|nr:cytochrome c family protein [Roseovarius sp. MMSF_3281]